jgi:hypothetical protein
MGRVLFSFEVLLSKQTLDGHGTKSPAYVTPTRRPFLNSSLLFLSNSVDIKGNGVASGWATLQLSNMIAWDISEIHSLDYGKVSVSTIRLDMTVLQDLAVALLSQKVRIDGHQTQFHAHILNLNENRAGDLLLGQNCRHMSIPQSGHFFDSSL